MIDITTKNVDIVVIYRKPRKHDVNCEKTSIHTYKITKIRKSKSKKKKKQNK